uniref:Uncharacterized protein n=1 Tax=Xenopus tropicalis TaxID=8364 RepID=A0A1B8Y3G5_XENTR
MVGAKGELPVPEEEVCWSWLEDGCAIISDIASPGFPTNRYLLNAGSSVFLESGRRFNGKGYLHNHRIFYTRGKTLLQSYNIGPVVLGLESEKKFLETYPYGSPETSHRGETLQVFQKAWRNHGEVLNLGVTVGKGSQKATLITQQKVQP